MTERTIVINVFNSYKDLPGERLPEVQINQVNMWNLILFGARVYSMQPSANLGNVNITSPWSPIEVPRYCAFENERCSNSIHLFCDVTSSELLSKLREILVSPSYFSNIIFNYIGHGFNAENIVAFDFADRSVNFKEIYDIFYEANANIFCHLYVCRRIIEDTRDPDNDLDWDMPAPIGVESRHDNIAIKPDKVCMIYVSSWRGELTDVIGNGGSMVQTIINMLKDERYGFFKDNRSMTLHELMKITHKVALVRLGEIVNVTKWESIIRHNPVHTEKFIEVCKRFPRIYVNTYVQSTSEYEYNNGNDINNLMCGSIESNTLNRERLLLRRTASVPTSTSSSYVEGDIPINLDTLIDEALITERPRTSPIPEVVRTLFHISRRYTQEALTAYQAQVYTSSINVPTITIEDGDDNVDNARSRKRLRTEQEGGLRKFKALSIKFSGAKYI